MRLRIAHKLIISIVLLGVLLPFFTSALEKPTCVISSPPGSIYPGSVTRLIWYSERAAQGYISNGIGPAPVPAGYVDVHPSVTTLYTMTVANAAGSNTCAALVTVVQNSAPSYLYYTPTVYSPVVFTPITYVPAMPTTYTTYTTETYYPGTSYREPYDFWGDFTDPSKSSITYGYSPQDPDRLRPGDDFVATFESTNQYGVTTTFYHDCTAGRSVDICDEHPFQTETDIVGPYAPPSAFESYHPWNENLYVNDPYDPGTAGMYVTPSGYTGYIDED